MHSSEGMHISRSGHSKVHVESFSSTKKMFFYKHSMILCLNFRSLGGVDENIIRGFFSLRL